MASVWIVEKRQGRYWMPLPSTHDCDKSRAEIDLKLWQSDFPSDKFRVSEYVRKEDGE